MSRVALLCLLLAAAPFAVPRKDPGRIQRMHAEVAARDAFDRTRSRTYDEVNASDHGITEIGLERDEPVGDGPAWLVVIRSDGLMRFSGIRHVERLGLYEGRTTRWQFDALAQFADELGFDELEHTYTGSGLAGSSVFTTVVRDGRRHVVRNDSRAGPPALWAFEQVVEKLVLETRWERLGDLDPDGR